MTFGEQLNTGTKAQRDGVFCFVPLNLCHFVPAFTCRFGTQAVGVSRQLLTSKTSVQILPNQRRMSRGFSRGHWRLSLHGV